MNVDVPAGTSVGDVRDAFRAALGAKVTDADVSWDRATDLMYARRLDEAVAAFEAILAAHPERRGDALNSIGACLHLLGRYEDAIRSYEEARAAGADPRTIDENILESRQALARGR